MDLVVPLFVAPTKAPGVLLSGIFSVLEYASLAWAPNLATAHHNTQTKQNYWIHSLTTGPCNQ